MTQAICQCYCHVNDGASCTIDTGYGAPGTPYCGPHLSGPLCLLAHGWQPDGHPRYKQAEVGHLCGQHRHWLDNVLLEIEMLLIDLGRCIESGVTPREINEGRTEHRKLADEKPVPINLDYLVLTDPRSGGARDHGITAEDPIGLVKLFNYWLARHDGRRCRTIYGALDELRLLHDTIAMTPGVVEYIDEMVNVRTILRRTVNDRKFRRIGICREINELNRACGGALLAENGTGVVHCQVCGGRWSTPEELARLSLRVTE